MSVEAGPICPLYAVLRGSIDLGVEQSYLGPQYRRPKPSQRSRLRPLRRR